MRTWQIFVLGFLFLLTLTVLGGTAAVVFRGWTGPVALAGGPVLEPTSQAPTQTAPPPAAATATAHPDYTATATPFQPLPITPTPTASPTFTPSPTPTASPSPTPLPTATPIEAVYISGIWGYRQAYPLSCESRSAADFARYFGVNFTELEFLFALPTSDNPETGFVGDAQGYLGQLPPLGYGVHAKPVARLMRDFGLDAKAHQNMSLEEIIDELNAGRPVMVWVITDLGTSRPVEYTASDGETVTVARFEHTVIVIGYGEDYITVLDNERIYSVTRRTFMDSWNVLGRMAITVEP